MHSNGSYAWNIKIFPVLLQIELSLCQNVYVAIQFHPKDKKDG